MKKRKLINKFTLSCAFILFCVSVFSAMPAIATEAIDLTLGGLISEKTVTDSGHVSVSENYEDQLNVIEYNNADGTRTIYSFPVPVKYKDTNNKISFIDNTLVKNRRDNGWNNKSNFFDVFASTTITDGIDLTYGDVKLTTTFSSSVGRSLNNSKPVYTVAKTLDYEGVDSKLSFAATYTGFSVEYFPDTKSVSDFSFTLSGNITNVYTEKEQLGVEMDNGSFVVYTLSVNDTSVPEKIIEATVSVSPMTDDSYLVACSVANPLTVAQNSVTILLSASIVQQTEQNERSVQEDGPWYHAEIGTHHDASVYSNGASTNYGSAIRCLVGVDGTMGTARTYVKFDLPNFTFDYHDIVSAKYRIRELTAYNAQFQAEVYMVKTMWSESGITWNNQPLCDNEKITTVNLDWEDQISYYELYITRAVMAWVQGLANYGIVIKSRNEDSISCRAFGSSEYSSYLPHLTITYNASPDTMENIGIVDNAQYYIKNKKSLHYLTANGTGDNASITQSAWTGANNQKWTLVPYDEEYYKLKPANATSKVLDTASNDYMRLYTSNNSSGQLFKFIRNWDGSYQIVTKSSDDESGLKVANDSPISGSSVIHSTHSLNWVKSDDWTLEQVDKGYAEVFTFTKQDYGIDTSKYAPDMLELLEDMGYWAYSYVDVHARIAYDLMSTEDVFIFSGHGGNGYLFFREDPSSEYNGILTARNTTYPAISAKPHNDLARMRAAVFAGCSTGADDGVDDAELACNLVGITYQRGAHFVLGRPETVAYPIDDFWVQKFLYYCTEGYTVYQAMCAADDYIYNDFEDETNITVGTDFGDANQFHVLGDYSLQLYH